MSQWHLRIYYKDDELSLAALNEKENGHLITIAYPATKNEIRQALITLADQMTSPEFA